MSRTGVICFPGSNCVQDALDYFHNSFKIWHKESKLPEDLGLLVIPGGFSFGDRKYDRATEKYTISPGEMALRSPCIEIIRKAVKQKIPILGICNGFQILINMKLLRGMLVQNEQKLFVCKDVECKINGKIESIPVAHGYGKFHNLYYSNVIMTYIQNPNGSDRDIAGVCNDEYTVFGIMPHIERTNLKFDLSEFFWHKIFEAMQSEHISYKSTERLLRQFPTKGPHVIKGPGDNAGIVKLNDEYNLTIRIESHNHPTFINPFEGAATGVGGIVRDIIAVGSKPIALLNFLFFAENDPKFWKAVKGISYYGNTIGIPNVGGSITFDETYENNPLVNVCCIGLQRSSDTVYGHALEPDLELIYVGAKTGRDGIGGAVMASKQLDSNSKEIQKSDAFLGRLLLDACCELAETNCIEGMQDFGAGGLLCASVEVVKRGRKKSGRKLGCKLYLDKVPVKEYTNMSYTDILLSETQERMLIVSKKENTPQVLEVFKKWDLEASVIGVTTEDDTFSVGIYSKSFEEFEKSYASAGNIVPEPFNPLPILTDDEIQRRVYETYDYTIGRRTIVGPDKKGNFAILDIPEVPAKLLITWGTLDECFVTHRQAKTKILGIVDCLNFGNLETLPQMAYAVQEITRRCKENKIPVLGGNVSMYNCTYGVNIHPTVTLVMVGTFV